MAPLASDARHALVPRLLELLKPQPGRLGFTLRLALVCSLTILVVEFYRTPEPALTAYVAFFMIKPDRTTSVLLSVVFVLLITLIVGLLLLVAMAVVDDPAWRVTAMTVISFVMLFAASASKLRPIGPIVALITAYGLDLVGRAQIGEVATRAILYVWLFIGIPAGISIVVNLLFGPAPRRLVERELADRLRQCAAALRTPNAETRSALETCLREGPGEIPAWLKLAKLERTSPAQDLAALAQAAASTSEILLLVDLVACHPEFDLPAPPRKAAADLLEQIASILDAGGYPTGISLAAIEPQHTLTPLSSAVLADLRQALARFAEPPKPTAEEEPPAKPKGGFFLPDAFTNPEHVQYALKTTGAAMFCYIVYSILDWPSIHTCLITCYIVSLGTAAETVEKLTLRVLGCFVGAAAGIAAIVFVMPHLTSIEDLLAIVFPVALVSAWIAAGPPRIAYAGFQLAFAFFLSVIQGSAPAFDMTIARDRVIGILFGNLVTYLVFTNLWPVSVTRRIDPSIEALLRRLNALAAATSPRRASLVIEAQAQRAAIEQDLELARYEPSGLRPPRAWLSARRRAVEAMAALQGPLLLTTTQAQGLSSEATARLTQLADRFGAPEGPRSGQAQAETVERPAPKKAGASKEMRALIEGRLANLEQALAQPVEAMRSDHAAA
jgi:multidrug resistance protein MdtO